MVGLVLEGGGAKGSYQVGAIKALKRRGIAFDGVVGTSIGSINGAIVASKDLRQLNRLWKKLIDKNIFGVNEEVINALKDKNINSGAVKKVVDNVGSVFKSKGVDTIAFRDIIESTVNEDNLRKSKIDYGLVTYNLTDKEPLIVFKKDIKKGTLSDHLLASGHLPIFKFDKLIDDKYYIDGGMYDNCPINMLLDKGYDKLYVIRLYTRKIRKPKANNASIIYVIPKHNLGSILLFEKDKMKDNISLGYYDTLKVLDNLDGNDYYIKPINDEFYVDVFQKVSKKHKLLQLLISKNNKLKAKETILKILEDAASNANILKYKVYSLKKLIKLIDENLDKIKYSKYIIFLEIIKEEVKK
ncbi:MAG: patatin-like phospholipase family protein [Bacilli bacterium]